jgi:3-phenylpropionate/trans-cinnamate dioxygenase ferredoxin reductase subunit
MGTLILGAGQAGASVAIELRRGGYAESIVIVGEEPEFPYQRPPLSKGWLKGEFDQERLTLRPEAWFQSNRVQVLKATRATAIDRATKQVHLDTGETIGFDHLVIATGARARRLDLPGSRLAGVLALRTAADAEQLKSRLGPGVRVALVGGGYVGLEIAASARALGAEVTVLERENRVLARVACPALSHFFTHMHAGQGVVIRAGAAVSGFIGEHGQVAGVQLADGSVIACDVVVVGIGAIPNDDIARSCGLPCNDGILVDASSRTEHPDIFAVGDVSRRWMARYERAIRFESVPSALEQSRQVAASLLGKPVPAEELPWFWSDQYDVKMQIAGIARDCDRIVQRGDPLTRQFALFHLRGNCIEAVEAVNMPGEFMFAKSLIARRIPVNVNHLADPSMGIRDITL